METVFRICVVFTFIYIMVDCKSTYYIFQYVFWNFFASILANSITAHQLFNFISLGLSDLDALRSHAYIRCVAGSVQFFVGAAPRN